MQQLKISDLLNNPDFYLFGFENGDALFLRMNRATYGQSIFFDGRIVTLDDNLIRIPMALLLALPPEAAAAPRFGWIFHMAHTGSTLLSRALDRPGKTLVIREPMTLRALGVEAAASRKDRLAADGWGERLHLALAMLNRRYLEDETVLVKANVPVNCIIPAVLEGAVNPKALLLHFGLEDYLTAILRGPNHRKWVENIFSELRLDEHSEIGQSGELQIAEKAAALWLFQIRIYTEVLAANPGVRSLDSNILFDEPLRCLQAASDYFNCPIGEDEAQRIVSGSLFSTYSKNPNAPFDNTHRKARVAETQAALADEIVIARRWIALRLASWPLPERLEQPLCDKNSKLL